MKTFKPGLDSENSRVIFKEYGIHGKTWDKIHGGYFSSPEPAGCFLREIEKVLLKDRPDAVVDLGGGTGFILSEIMKKKPELKGCFVNVDVSLKQRHNQHDGRILFIEKSITDFSRAEISPPPARFFFIMRSVLHYFGREEFLPVLRKLRSRMKNGEFFVHQTACFKSPDDASLMNLLYQRMNTGKWYPTGDELRSALRKAGFQTYRVCPAPPLPLTFGELARRYRLSETSLRDIRSELLERYGERKNLFAASGKDFCAYLPYAIFSCRAIPL